MQIIVAGQVVDYSDEGKGPVLLMVHGWRDQKTTWQPLIKALKTDFRCVAIDLPNFGASSDNESVVDLAGFANALAQFVEKISLKDYILVGHSMGGQIGIYAVGQGILHPKKLILIASAGVRDDSASKRKVLKAGAVVFRRFIPTAAKKKLYQAIGSDYDPSLKPTHKAIIDAVLSADVQHEAALIQAPTLLVYGSKDTSTPPKHGQVFHKLIMGSRYTEILGGDHWIHQKAATEIAEAMKAFIKGETQ
jgi:pimeloyl-ACP methyl ester carboxylesterase